jgi:hypothetical protein
MAQYCLDTISQTHSFELTSIHSFVLRSSKSLVFQLFKLSISSINLQSDSLRTRFQKKDFQKLSRAGLVYPQVYLGTMHFTFVTTLGVSALCSLALAEGGSDMRFVSRSALNKRAVPKLDPSLKLDDPHRGGKLTPRAGFPESGALNNALELMSYATTLPGSKNDNVFKKYFNTEDKTIVQNVFKRLLGDDQKGASALANILIKAGNKDEKDPAPAHMEKFDDPEPEITISEDGW